MSETVHKQRAQRDAVARGVTVVIVSVAILVVIGVVMVFSATGPASIRAADADPGQRMYTIALRQAAGAVAGGILGYLVAHISYSVTRWLGFAIVCAGCALQIGALVQGDGVGGNINWLSFGFISIQPSEFIKFGLVVWLAHLFATMTMEDMHNWRKLALPLGGFAVIALLVGVLGGDMGTTLILALIAVGMAFYAGLPWKWLAWTVGAGAVVTVPLIVMQASRSRRVREFIDGLFTLPDTVAPTQIEYAQFAFGSGGIAGVGIGAGKEKWRDLSEAHTDFIFAVIGEELGLFGTLVVIALFVALAWGLLQVCVHHPSRYAQLIVIGAALWLCGQAFANMFVVTGLLPVFGVPLPFVSMGGSSLVAGLAMVGAVYACAAAVPGVRGHWHIGSRIVQGVRTVVRRKQ